MSERTATPPADDVPEEDDDTVQGVSKRAEVEVAEAQAIQDELNEAAGMTPAEEAPAEPAPAPEAKAPRKPSGA
jgi:hypothetical protein